MSPTTSTPVLRISAVIAVTCLDSDPAGCTTLAASLSSISCSGLRCDCGELIILSTLGSALDPSRYYSTQDQCMLSKARFANPTAATDVRQTGATDGGFCLTTRRYSTIGRASSTSRQETLSHAVQN